MNKEEAVEEFFKNFKIIFNVASLYNKEHPYFIKSAAEFKKKIDTTLMFLNPIKIGIAADYLLVEEKKFSGLALYEELAKMLHQRKIKSIELREGVTVEELAVFLKHSSSPPKDILKAGGIANILRRERIKHIYVDELDYSQLLKGDSVEYKDIWAYLLKNTVVQNDSQKTIAFADDFEKTIGQFKLKELLADAEIREYIRRFLNHLEAQDKDKFFKCSKQMAKSILSDKDVYSEASIEEIKTFFKDLSEDDLSAILSDEILNNDNFDSLSFNLFSNLVDNRKSEKIASLTAEALKKSSLSDKHKIKKRMENLFSQSGNSAVSEVYRNSLFSLLKDISFGREFLLDYALLKKNYFLILLNLLAEEEDGEKLNIILERLSKSWEEIALDKDPEYVKSLVEIIKKKRASNPDLDSSFKQLYTLISAFIENIIWEENICFDIEYFIDALQTNSLDIDFYIDKIFNENKVNSGVLKLFLKFFPDCLYIFYENLNKKYLDAEFIVTIIKSLKGVASPLSVEILKHIYSSSNILIKIEVLRAMQDLPIQDNNFLLSILSYKNPSLKKEALALLMRDKDAQRDTLEMLFSIPSPWGSRNNVLLENITIVEEMGLKEARDYLINLSRKRFFWNRSVRKKANEALKKII